MMDDPSPKRFHYSARTLAVTDGDTVTLELDLGLWIKRVEKLRLHGINAPEMVGASKLDGMKAKNALCRLLAGAPVDPWTAEGSPILYEGLLDEPLVVQTFKDADDKFGRLLARIYVQRYVDRVVLTPEWICVNDELVKLGYAVAWDGKGARP